MHWYNQVDRDNPITYFLKFEFGIGTWDQLVQISMVLDLQQCETLSNVIGSAFQVQRDQEQF